ncbi:MAG TPA: hypothetical protein VN758_14395 [Solirubrobacterales bacterium]|nr:hypothetical protein [Solirubrobacterales bacterium]
MAVQLPRWQSATLAFALYLLLSAVLVGHGALAHFGSATIGYGPDPPVFTWDLKWWPQAIADGLDPLHSAVVYAPQGFNTTLMTSIAGPSLVMAPVTQTFGPLASYNALAILIPALNAWAAFLLCRQVGGSSWAALAGGYAFGFSTYVLGQSLGHPNLSLVAMAPLAVYLVLRRRNKSIGTIAFVACLTIVLAFQFLTSTEVFLTMTMMGVAVYGLALLILPAQRASLLPLAAPIAGAYVAAGLLVSPFLLAAVTAHLDLTHIDPVRYSADPLNLVIPTRITIGGETLAGIGDRFTGNLSENGTYLGLPLLLVLGLFGWQRRRDRITLFLLAAFGIALIGALGPRLNLLGSPTSLRLPWAPFLHLPYFKYVLPERLIVFAWLALAVILTLWLSTPSRWPAAKWALAAVGLALLLPNPGATDPSPPHYGAAIWASRRPLPGFFAGGDSPQFRGRPNLLVLPYNEAGEGDSVYWQASAGMAYAMPGGYLTGTIPEDFACWPIVGQLRAEDYSPANREGLLDFLAAKQVDAVVAPTAVARRAAPLLAALPGPPHRSGGVLVYEVPPMRDRMLPEPCRAVEGEN